MKDWSNLQPALAYASHKVDENVTLNELASKANQSVYHIHRQLRAVVGETPKQFTLRLRLDRAAAALITSSDSILDIALAFGFESHETFCRAFRRRYEMTPRAYRKQGLSGTKVLTHAAFVSAIGPCVGLYHIGKEGRSIPTDMEYTITQEERAEQQILVVRRKVKRADIAATIGAELPKVFLHAQRRGISIAGYPITRYLEISMGSVTLETGMRVAGHLGSWTTECGEGDVIAEALPGGLIAVTVHSGPYDQLQNAYAALEEWITENGFQGRSAPWEAYLNDPGDHPDPKDWETEVCWPIS